jgi:hypothetical protein
MTVALTGADAPDVPASPVPPIAKAKIKAIRIIIYLPKERTAPDDLQHVGHYEVRPISSCSGVLTSHVRE